MKKIIMFLFLMSIIYICYSKESVIIPNNAIRFRIIANSNDLNDQELKLKIKNDLKKEIIPQLSANNREDTNKLIVNNLSEITKIVSKYTSDFDIKYGSNYFPNKTYNGVKYKEGMYQSLVITLGDGLGKNWWCVLYPPLCLVDENNIEYTSLIKEIVDKY